MDVVAGERDDAAAGFPVWVQPGGSGLVTKLNDVAAGDSAQTSASTDRQCFSYDFLQRLTQAWTSSGNACAAPSASTLGATCRRPGSVVYRLRLRSRRAHA